VPCNTCKYPYITGFKAKISTHSAIPAGFHFVSDPVLWFILCQTFQARICLFFRTSSDIRAYFTSLGIKRVMVYPPTVQNSRITQGGGATPQLRAQQAWCLSQCFSLCKNVTAAAAATPSSGSGPLRQCCCTKQTWYISEVIQRQFRLMDPICVRRRKETAQSLLPTAISLMHRTWGFP
jgi:hypothetical protein